MAEITGTTNRLPLPTGLTAAPARVDVASGAAVASSVSADGSAVDLGQDLSTIKATGESSELPEVDLEHISLPEDCPETNHQAPPPVVKPPQVQTPQPTPATASPSPAPTAGAPEAPPPAQAAAPSESTPSLPPDAIIIGNKRRPRSVRSFLKYMKKRGIELPFDIKSLPKELLNTKLKKGQSLAIGADGKMLGFLETKDVMANQSLGVSGHLTKNRVDITGGLPRSETLGQGGSITVGGQEVNVVKTYLKSPIMLDLTGDGQLGTTGNSTAKERIDNHVGKTVQFDVDGDGVLDNTEWMSGNGDGMLVDDRDGGATRASQGDGRIDGTRLFGDEGGKFANGYDKLALHDADGDGKLTGQELEGLKVWVDNGDAKLEAHELKSLAELGVSEMSVKMNLEKNARGEDLMRSTFVRDGKEQVTEDVWFNTKQ